mmetsp:Transcript_33013/g.67455  ORF Transcript_33013/g.67455 Transcript_33013/m.67455 type:complete len:398 (+) Transcript_33013:144-1337(+)
MSMTTSSHQSKLWVAPRRVILTLLSFLIANHSLSTEIIVNAFRIHHESIFPRGSIPSFTTLTRQFAQHRQSNTRLHGVHEWRAKYSNHNNTSSQHQQQQDQLPLLLLPFNPTQILLPGQTTSYTFRHGKYMDLIDESITHYESVIGMSILSDDGLLPITVLCEVIEEELEIHMGYRGFSAMEVGIRAVGRVRRCDVNSNNNNSGSAASSRSTAINDDLRTTALDDIHQGKVVDWFDDPLDEEQKIAANEYTENIVSILRLRQEEDEEQRSSERLRNQQMNYKSAYDIISLDKRTNNNSDNVDSDFTATSWGAFAAAAAAAAIDRPGVDGSVVNIDALSTTNTVERLRLGLAMLLENQMPLWSNEEVDGRSGETIRSVRGNGGESTSTPLQDGIDTFQ